MYFDISMWIWNALNNNLHLLNVDTMENWDEAKLEDVVNQKHGESDQNKPKTAIVSCSQF